MARKNDRLTPSGSVLVLSGPSGAGKSTVCAELLSQEPDLSFSVSCTTRPPRAGERDGREYHFLSETRFREYEAQEAFLESAVVHGHRYGTLLHDVEAGIADGRSVLLDIDVQGARQIRERTRDTQLAAHCVFVFLGPPSRSELERRLRSRGTEEEEVIAARLRTAKSELAAWREYEYLVVNDRVEAAVSRLQAVLRSAACAPSRYVRAPWEDEEPEI